MLKEISQETFDKFRPRYIKDQENILKQLAKFTQSISNPEEAIEQALVLSSKLPIVWNFSDTGAKEKLQKLIVPDGIVYDRKNESFRTPKVNTIFSRIAHLSGKTPENEKGTNHTDDDLSLLAGYRGQSSNQFADDLSEIQLFKQKFISEIKGLNR